MYDHTKQYRCTIIRGKSQKEIDDILPAYTKIITDICPCSKEKFEIEFNVRLAEYIPSSATKKTLDNHRTEIAGKLFGMYFVETNGVDTNLISVFPSERTLKFAEDSDQPAFFKDVCFKMQFPNGMTKIKTLKERIAQKISIRPNAYLLKVLLTAKNAGLELTKSDIGYYVLNSLDVLRLAANPIEVIGQIERDKKDNISRKVHTPSKASSYDNQHINEQINYLELANLIIVKDDSIVKVNEHDMDTVILFANTWDSEILFDVKKYDLSIASNEKLFQLEWDHYYSTLSLVADKLDTTPASLGIIIDASIVKQTSGMNKVELGNEGEYYVLNYEKERVKKYDVRLAGKVVHLGKTRGLGYDIQSVIAENGDMAEFVKYIEVKSTKRVTAPDMNDALWVDTLNITQNEWIAAMQHKDFYSIFRVYFVRDNVLIYIMKDIHKKINDGIVKIAPITYRVDFTRAAIDEIILNKAQVI